MLRPLKSSKTPRLSKEAKNLIEWCISLDQSGSRLEDTFWELKVNHAINKLLTTGNEKPLETALEYLSEHHPGGFEALIEQAENLSSMCLVEVDGQHWQALLVSAPVVCWTRYQIPNHTVGPAQSDTLLLALKDVVLAENTSLAMVPKLISLDQMPQSFAETLTWTKQLAQLAITQSGPLPTLNAEPEHTGILADSRHLVMVVVAPVGEPIFKWQEKVNNRRDKCGPKWSKAVHTSLASLLAGCEFESLLPDAYYLNLRESDKFVRPLTI